MRQERARAARDHLHQLPAPAPVVALRGRDRAPGRHASGRAISRGGRKTLSASSPLRTNPKPARFALTTPTSVRDAPPAPRPTGLLAGGHRTAAGADGSRSARELDVFDVRDLFRKTSVRGWE